MKISWIVLFIPAISLISSLGYGQSDTERECAWAAINSIGKRSSQARLLARRFQARLATLTEQNPNNEPVQKAKTHLDQVLGESWDGLFSDLRLGSKEVSGFLQTLQEKLDCALNPSLGRRALNQVGRGAVAFLALPWVVSLTAFLYPGEKLICQLVGVESSSANENWLNKGSPWHWLWNDSLREKKRATLKDLKQSIVDSNDQSFADQLKLTWWISLSSRVMLIGYQSQNSSDNLLTLIKAPVARDD